LHPCVATCICRRDGWMVLILLRATRHTCSFLGNSSFRSLVLSSSESPEIRQLSWGVRVLSLEALRNEHKMLISFHATSPGSACSERKGKEGRGRYSGIPLKFNELNTLQSPLLCCNRVFGWVAGPAPSKAQATRCGTKMLR
jgi:hypothetical protein